jgi:hypothetical protein
MGFTCGRVRVIGYSGFMVYGTQIPAYRVGGPAVL